MGTETTRAVGASSLHLDVAPKPTRMTAILCSESLKTPRSVCTRIVRDLDVEVERIRRHHGRGVRNRHDGGFEFTRRRTRRRRTRRRRTRRDFATSRLRRIARVRTRFTPVVSWHAVVCIIAIKTPLRSCTRGNGVLSSLRARPARRGTRRPSAPRSGTISLSRNTVTIDVVVQRTVASRLSIGVGFLS